MGSTPQYDLLVVGAGPAGALCATEAARGGARVLLVDADSDPGGPPMVVDVEETAFAALGLASPAGEELAFAHAGVEVASPAGRIVFQLPSDGTLHVRRDRLFRRLLTGAQLAGAELRAGHRAIAPVLEGHRVSGVILRTRQGQVFEVTARAIVDASGHAAALVRALPAGLGLDFSDREADRVVAWTRLCHVPAAQAEESSRRLGQRPEYVTTRMGIQGSYSTELTCLSPRQELAYVLIGVKAGQVSPAPVARTAAWVAALGPGTEEIVSGGGPIRIRRASLRLVADGFAVCGESAGMVIPMHGSGISTCLLAGQALGRQLVAILGAGREPTAAALWPWAATYQRTRGAILASYDMNRRLVERFEPTSEVEPLISHGLLQPEDMSATFVAEPVRVRLASIPRRIPGVLRHPWLGGRFLAAGPRILLTELLWRRYPTEPDEVAFARWRALAERWLP